MPRNRIPRTRTGDRVWSQLTSNERVVLAAIYRQSGRTFDELKAATGGATGLSSGQLSTTLRALQSPRRCGPLGVPAVVSKTVDGAGAARYGVTAAWAAARRVPTRAAA